MLKLSFTMLFSRSYIMLSLKRQKENLHK